MPRVLPAVLMAAAAAFPAHAADWGQLATISSTLGVNANRLCVGEGLRSDIGCPTYTPYVSATSGYIGIGVTSPQASLHISNSTPSQLLLERTDPSYGAQLWFRRNGTNTWYLRGGDTAGLDDFVFRNSASAAIFALRQNGNVGISTTNPNAKLDVYGDISATNLRLSGNLYVSGSQTFDGVTFANGGVSATGIITATSFSGDGSQLTGLASGDRITSGTTNVLATQDRSVTITTAGSQRVVIGENGNVGIGTANPLTGLHVENPNYNGQLLITRGNGSGYYLTQSGNVGSIGAYGTTNQFSIFGSAFSVLSSGNIGIGTISPNAKLDVNGTVSASIFNANTLASAYQLNGISAMGYTGGHVFLSSVGGGVGLRDNGAWVLFSDAGNVGIGTTSPQAALQVSGSFTVSTSAQTTTPSLYVGTNGRIGLGTSSPGSELSIHGVNAQITMTDASATANNGYISFGNTPGAGGNLIIGTTSSGPGYGAVNIASAGPFRVNAGSAGYLIYGAQGLGGYRGILAINSPFPGTLPGAYVSGSIFVASTPSTNPSATLHVAGTGRITSWTTIAANVTPTTELDVYGTISATNILVNGAPITGNADRITSGTTSAIAYNGGSITFTTANSQRMVIGENGNVGIGTTGANRLLTVNGAMGFKDSGIESLVIASDGEGFAFLETKNSKPLAFWVSGAGEVMRMTTAGKVGIGTTSPAKTLDVSGTAQIVSRTLVGGTGTPSATFQVSGSLLLAGNDNIPCTASVLGLVRRNPTTGRMQVCR